MPAVPAPAHILVTGASSFIATHVVRQLLDGGYTVTGTVRSEEKADYLRQLFSKYGESKLKFIIVKDVGAPGAFDGALAGIDGIEHLASPFHFNAEDPKELIEPAVNGTTGILKSAATHGSQVKRVVITSSLAAVSGATDKPVGYHWTEDDWNNVSTKDVEDNGKKASNANKYQASKTLAERAAWDFVESHKGKISFDIATVNPSYVFGPTIHQVKSVDALNTSVSMFREKVLERGGKDASKDELAASMGSWVDVRDVAAIHVAALGTPAAGGQRYLASAGPFTWQDVFDSLAKAGVTDVNKGFSGAGKTAEHRPAIGVKAEKELNFHYRTLDETVLDTYKSLKERFYESK